jgi:hypothetical protein
MKASGPSRTTVVLRRLFPVSWPRRFRSSTSTSTSRPTDASSVCREMRAWSSSKTWFRRSLTGWGTSSGQPAASVPGRGEYLKMNALSYRTRSISAHVASKSASVSPGKPTMMSVERATSGTSSRRRAMFARYVSTA